jgi:ATP-dependent helicase/nuclease subunit A
MRALSGMGEDTGDRESRDDSTPPLQLTLAYEQAEESEPDGRRWSSEEGHPSPTGSRESPRLLTDEQELAVTRRDGSLFLAADSGSGKTSVLVERFVRAVREDGVVPGRILAITFTERAAGELRERVRARLLELGDREAARAAEAANVSTFHGFCARLLRAHPLQAGVEPGFQILEAGLADRLRALAFADALAGFVEGERSPAVDLVAAHGADPLRAIVIGAYDQLRSQGEEAPRLPAVVEEAKSDERAVRARELISELIERFGEAYTQRKHARAALDFDDLELRARGLLEQRKDVRDLWAERLQMIMVDEFQDSNGRQLAVLAALDRDNLFTVGDELQSIYGFRHANVELFRKRQAQLGERGASLALTRNFRSRPAILAAVERIFAERVGERFSPLTPVRPSASAASAQDPTVELLLTDRRGWERFPGDDDLEGLPEATPWRQAEARLLAGRLAELVASGAARAGEIVVLLRALGDLPVYESALRRRGLRTLAAVGGFWSDQQVGDLLAWLRALANPLDELALYSTLASPLVGVSSDGLALIATVGREQRRGTWQAIGDRAKQLEGLLSASDRERIASFYELFVSERASAPSRSLAELLRRAVAVTGYDAHVLSLNWGERRFANVQKLVRLARDFEAQEGRDLRGFLDHVAHVEVAFSGREADAPVGDGLLDAVRLMSIHAAKGLEFPVVCVADLGRDPNLRVPDLLVDALGGRVGLRMPQLGGAEPAVALDFEDLREERRAAQEQEEDRILYVACTRARDRLLLSGSVAFERWPQDKPGVAPIAWLAPALVPDAPKLVACGELPTTGLTVEVGKGLPVRCLFDSPAHHARLDGAPKSIEQTEIEGPTMQRGTSSLGSPRPMPLPLEDPDATMSYTALAELERCGYRYYLERVLRLPENRAASRSGAEDEGIEARTRGTIVHALLESVDFSRPLAPSSRDVAVAARRIGASVGAEERQEIVALIAGGLTAEPAGRLAHARRARSEHPFAFSLGHDEPLVTGVLDLIVEEPDGRSLIVDYKSDRLLGEEDLEKLVRRDYGIQRLLYALAAIEDGAHEVEVAHWFLERPSTWVSARFAAHERHRLRERLLARVAVARARGFTVTQAPHRKICITCPGRGGLCSWGETHTMSERSTTLESEE